MWALQIVKAYSLFKVLSFGDDIGVSVVVLRECSAAHKSFKTCLCCQLRLVWVFVSVNRGLKLFLHFGRRIFENAEAIVARAVDLCFHSLLRLGEAIVHHHLVVQHKLHLALVLGVEVILAGREVVFLFSKGGGVRVFAI